MRGVGCWRFDARRGRSQPLLEGIDWRIERGEQWAVLGPNGAGKSTLVTIAGAAGFPSAGTAEVLGETLGATDMRLLRRRIGFVEPRTTRRIEPALSARQVVETGATATLFPLPDRLTAANGERADELLERFGCAAVARRAFGDCSDGERRRVLLARALMRRPELVILDEPAAGLDLPGREGLVEALAGLAAADGVTTVLVTHHPEELPATTTHALLLRGGRTTAQGPAAAVIGPEQLSECFGVAVAVDRRDGRWTARARGSFSV
jgi:iron complex transport system ATP-binding protein